MLKPENMKNSLLTLLALLCMVVQGSWAHVWYTVDGRRVGGKPPQKGLYIINGKKVVIK
jgi:hypothetical protein